MLDISGAILIVSPILELIKMPEQKLQKKYLDINNTQISKINKLFAWLGIVTLIIGFVMQIIGNLMQATTLN